MGADQFIDFILSIPVTGMRRKMMFLPRVKMNSINWFAPINMWIFITQLVEHYSAKGEAMGSSPVEALNFFFFGLKFAIA